MFTITKAMQKGLTYKIVNLIPLFFTLIRMNKKGLIHG